jgi:hypothetical protein
VALLPKAKTTKAKTATFNPPQSPWDCAVTCFPTDKAFRYWINLDEAMQRPRLTCICMAVTEECFVLSLVSHYLLFIRTPFKHGRPGKKQRLERDEWCYGVSGFTVFTPTPIFGRLNKGLVGPIVRVSNTSE